MAYNAYLLFAMPMRLLLLPVLLVAAAAADDRTCDEQHLASSLRAGLHSEQRGQDELPATESLFASPQEEARWLAQMSERLLAVLPRDSILRNPAARRDFLRTVHYEATRAGLDVQKVLAIMHVESAFRKYAISSAGARGYMQVMPFWVEAIGDVNSHNLFALRTNLRYGTIIFRCYLDMEKGDYYLALGRYNGSRGRAKYPRAVFEKEQKYWH